MVSDACFVNSFILHTEGSINMDMDMEMNSTLSPSGGSRIETSPYIMYSQQQQIRHDSSEKMMSEYHVLVPGTCRIPVVLVYSIRGLLYIEEDQTSWICSDPENLRKRNTYALFTYGIRITLQEERNGLTIGDHFHFSQFIS